MSAEPALPFMAFDPEKRRMRVASYNIHGAIGTDGQYSPERVMSVIAITKAELLGLQEIRYHPKDPEHILLRLQGSMSPWHVVQAPTIESSEEIYGNAIISRYPIELVKVQTIAVPQREARNVLLAKVDIAPKLKLLVMTTHFGLRRWERKYQARQLINMLEAASRDFPNEPLCLLGDFNEWLPNAAPLRILRSTFGSAKAIRTFPSTYPLLPLDRIYCLPHGIVTDVSTVRTANARKASDHLPLVADLILPA